MCGCEFHYPMSPLGRRVAVLLKSTAWNMESVRCNVFEKLYLVVAVSSFFCHLSLFVSKMQFHT